MSLKSAYMCEYLAREIVDGRITTADFVLDFCSTRAYVHKLGNVLFPPHFTGWIDENKGLEF